VIILSGALVVMAIALLIAGILLGNAGSEVVGLDGLTMIYVSITVSIVSALCLAIGVYVRRRELFGKVDIGQIAETPKASKKAGKKARKRGKGGPGPNPDAESTVEEPFTLPAPPVDVPADAIVHVVSGRRRYHLDSCRQLAGRDREELTYAEAREEGFSPCTACMPDTALAARAAGSDAGSPPTAALGAVGTGSTTAASSSTARGDWAARRAGGVGRELFVPRPSHAEPGDATTDEATAKDLPSIERRPTAEWSTSATSRAEETTEKAAYEEATDEQIADQQFASRTSAKSNQPDESTAAAAEPEAEPDREDAAAVVRDDDQEATAKAVDGDAATDDTATAEPAKAASATAPGADPGPPVRILSGTKRYHRAECALIEDIGDETDDLETLSRAEAKARGCTPCLVCQPDLEQAR
jgi:hypothetical protein